MVAFACLPPYGVLVVRGETVSPKSTDATIEGIYESTEPEQFLKAVDLCLRDPESGYKVLDDWINATVLAQSVDTARFRLAQDFIRGSDDTVMFIDKVTIRKDGQRDIGKLVSLCQLLMPDETQEKAWQLLALAIKGNDVDIASKTILAMMICKFRPSNASDFKDIFSNCAGKTPPQWLFLEAASLAGDSAATDSIITLCQSEDKTVRRAAAKTLSQTLDKTNALPKALERLSILRKDDDPVVRFWATIGDINAGQDVDQVESFDDDTFVKDLTAKAETNRFCVYGSDSENDANQIVATAEDCVTRAEHFFDTKWEMGKVAICIVNDTLAWECMSLHNTRTADAGAYWDDKGKRIFLSNFGKDTNMVLAHEIFHAAADLWIKERKSIPLFFEEGLAYYYQHVLSGDNYDEKEWRNVMLWWAIYRNDFLPMDSAAEFGEKPHSQMKRELALLEGKSFVMFLMQQHGSEVQELMSRLRKGSTFQAAVKVAFKDKFQQAWDIWKESLKKYTLPPVTYGPLSYLHKHNLPIDATDVITAVELLAEYVNNNDIEGQTNLSNILSAVLEKSFRFDLTATTQDKLRECKRLQMWLLMNMGNLIWSKEKGKLVLHDKSQELILPDADD
jgi:hypothetical protein